MQAVVQYRKTLLKRTRLLWFQAHSEESLFPIFLKLFNEGIGYTTIHVYNFCCNSVLLSYTS